MNRFPSIKFSVLFLMSFLLMAQVPAGKTDSVALPSAAPAMPPLPDKNAVIPAEEYRKADYLNLTKSLIRLGALNLTEDKVLDEFASLAECDLFIQFFYDDFKWQKIRNALRAQVRQDVETYPVAFYYDTKFQLDRYDFKDRQFHFMGDVEKNAVNTFTFTDGRTKGCGGYDMKVLPIIFKLVLDQPMDFIGLPMNENEAKLLLKRMELAKNKNRVVHARFKMRALFAEPLTRTTRKNVATPERLQQRDSRGSGVIHINARMDSVAFYEDEERTKLIFSYQP